jgi:ABC-type siderophore export system fused ATPase/permease subunit
MSYYHVGTAQMRFHSVLDDAAVARESAAFSSADTFTAVSRTIGHFVILAAISVALYVAIKGKLKETRPLKIFFF